MIDYEVRDGKKVTPTCSECGCRLYQPYGYAWGHYQSERFPIGNGQMDLTDMQGHKCSMRYMLAAIYNGEVSFTSTGPHVFGPIK